MRFSILTMHKLSLAILVACSAPFASAQTVSEISGMTVPASQVQMSSLSPGPTFTGNLNAAGTNGGACFCSIIAIPKPIALGVYNTNTGCAPLALGADPNAPASQDPQPLFMTAANGTFNSVSYRLELATPHTEIGIGVGDWNGPLILRFHRDGALLVTMTTSSYSASSCTKFFQMNGGTFDRVDVDTSTAAGNIVLTDLWTEQCSATTHSFGSGCQGSSGVPAISQASPPASGSVFAINVTNTVGPWAMVIGLSSYHDPGLGKLPFDLGALGAPGCDLLCSLDLVQVSGSGSGFALPIPANIGVCLCFQVVGIDAGANALGVTTSNGLQVFVR